MSFVVTNLQSDLYTTFENMNDIKDGTGNQYMAENVAKNISNFISTGTVTSIDGGTAGDGGVYVGAGTGSMQISESDLKNKLLNTFQSECENDELATRIATDIDDVCKVSNTCSTTTTGTSTISGQSPHPYSGSGKGTFTGSKSIIENKLKTCFQNMNNIKDGTGNLYFATEFASAVNSYLTGGSISITLQPPMSGSGQGAIA